PTPCAASHPPAVRISILSVWKPPASTTPHTLSLHDALPISPGLGASPNPISVGSDLQVAVQIFVDAAPPSPTAVTVSVPSNATSIEIGRASCRVRVESSVAGGGVAGTTVVRAGVVELCGDG